MSISAFLTLIVVLKCPSALTSVYLSLGYTGCQGSLCYIYVLNVRHRAGYE